TSQLALRFGGRLRRNLHCAGHRYYRLLTPGAWSRARRGLNRIALGVLGVLLLPGVPAAKQHLQSVVAELVLVVELLRRTGAFILGRSLAVRYDQLVLGQLSYPCVYV